jgi:transcription antitermination factor NusA-like protein
MVVKALPDRDSLLTLIAGTELMALLPKRYANRAYRVGESTIASIFAMEGERITLSQRSSQYFRKLVELLLSPLLQEGKVEVKRAATVLNARFAKVSLRGLGGEDPISVSIPYLKDLRRYTDDTITLVKFSPDLREYVVNSLSPAPRERVKKVIHFQTLRQVLVKVEPPYLGLFLGKGGMNAAVSSKLVGVSIKIDAV